MQAAGKRAGKSPDAPLTCECWMGCQYPDPGRCQAKSTRRGQALKWTSEPVTPPLLYRPVASWYGSTCERGPYGGMNRMES
jgi:hypothetical protein